MYTLVDSVPPSQLSQHAAERYAQLEAVSAQPRSTPSSGDHRFHPLRRLVHRVREVWA